MGKVSELVGFLPKGMLETRKVKVKREELGVLPQAAEVKTLVIRKTQISVYKRASGSSLKLKSHTRDRWSEG